MVATMTKMFLPFLLVGLVAIQPFVQGAGVARADGLVHGEGRLVATVGVVLKSVDEISAILPEGLELSPIDGVPAGYHPMLMIFGQQKDVSTFAGSLRVGSIADYHEMLWAIPNVRLSGSSKNRFYFAKFYVDSEAAKLAGIPFAFPKHSGVISESDLFYSAQGLHESAPRFYASLTDVPVADEARMNANFQWLRPLLDQEIIARKAGIYRCTVMDHHLDEAIISPVTMTGKTEEGALDDGDLSGSAGFAFELNDLSHDPFGSFRLDTRWTINTPTSCHD